MGLRNLLHQESLQLPTSKTYSLSTNNVGVRIHIGMFELMIIINL